VSEFASGSVTAPARSAGRRSGIEPLNAVPALYKTVVHPMNKRRINKNTPAAKWDEGFRGTTQIQKGRSPFLGILNAEIRSVFTEKLRGSTCP